MANVSRPAPAWPNAHDFPKLYVWKIFETHVIQTFPYQTQKCGKGKMSVSDAAFALETLVSRQPSLSRRLARASTGHHSVVCEMLDDPRLMLRVLHDVANGKIEPVCAVELGKFARMTLHFFKNDLQANANRPEKELRAAREAISAAETLLRECVALQQA